MAACQGAALWIRAPRVSVRASIVHDPSSFGGPMVWVGQAAGQPYPSVSWEYNDTFPANFAGMADPTGSDGNISAEPSYVHPFGDDYAMGPQIFDYHLVPGSPGIDAGPPELRDPDGSRADIGAYGGPFAQ